MKRLLFIIGLLLLALPAFVLPAQAQENLSLTARDDDRFQLTITSAGYDFASADTVQFALWPFIGHASRLLDLTCDDVAITCADGSMTVLLDSRTSSYWSLSDGEYYYELSVRAASATGFDTWLSGDFAILGFGAPGASGVVNLTATINTGGTAVTVTVNVPGGAVAGTFGGAGSPGIVPDPGTENGYYLQDDGTWSQVSSTDDQNASEVAVTPAGGISSTDAQNALEELDSEKAALGHNHAAGDINSGVLAHERGGLEVDLSAYNGLIRIASGTTINITNLAGLNTALGSTIADGAHTVDTKLTQEEVQDSVGPMASGGTQTRITFTYNDATNKFDLVVDDMNQTECSTEACSLHASTTLNGQTIATGPHTTDTGPTVDCSGNEVQRADDTCVDLDDNDATVNEAGDPVSWYNLKDMPAGFADGSDDGGGGSSVVLDLADDDSNESTGITEIATTGDTNSIFTEPAADKLLINVGLNWPSADIADAIADGDYGGISVSSGVWSIDAGTVGALEQDLADTYNWTGAHTWSGTNPELTLDGSAGAFLNIDRASTSNSGFVRFRTGGTIKWLVGLHDTGATDNFFIADPSGNHLLEVQDNGTDGIATVDGELRVEDDITFDKCEYTASASTITVDATDCPASEALLDEASITISLTNAAASTRVGSIRIKVLQDATGNRDPSWTGVNWAGGTEPTWSTGANDFDVVGCDVIDGNFYCYLAAGGF